MKLAVVQMVLGVFIVGNYAGGLFRLPFIPGAYSLILLPYLHVSVVLGLAVLGCGIAQYIKAKGFKGAMPL